MGVITVCASRNYEVRIEKGLLSNAGSRIAGIVSPCCAAVISDDTVFSLYGKTLCRSLEQAGFRVCTFCFAHGEASKNLTTYGKILNFLAENHLTRSDLLIALGGGVVGDLGGFAAATYLRGIEYVQIPTTLLAAVDSSVGGKTAVDLSCGKNLAGAFYQPSLVLCDPDTLRSLPEEIFRDGCAEVIKYAVIGNPGFFTQLGAVCPEEQLELIIETCVRMKRDTVQQDEFDRGLRQTLNFGHTFGHAIEACSGYTVSHGSAVAIGMCMMAKAAAKKGFCDPSVSEQIEDLVRKYKLPTKTDFSVDRLMDALRSDKKAQSDHIHLIVPQKIGTVSIETVALADVSEWLRLGGAD